MKQPTFNSLYDLQKYFSTEESCHDALAFSRWGDKPVCIHCGSSRKIYKIAKGLLRKCADCRKPFSVRIGTIFEDSALPLQKWFIALYLLTAHKKGISSMQLSKDIQVTQKTAWFMLHRLRYALGHGFMPDNKIKLDGVVEADETYIGGKAANRHGRVDRKKATVFGMADRDDGLVVVHPVRHINARILKGIIRSTVTPDSKLMTDEFAAYTGLGKEFASHETVNHSEEEYVRGDVHTNTIEGFWSLLKRGIIGIYHQVSVDHLHRYCDEFQYRYNTRKVKDAQRFSKVLTHLNGRLMYKNLIGQNV